MNPERCPLCEGHDWYKTMKPLLNGNQACYFCLTPVRNWPAVQALRNRSERADGCIVDHEQRWVRLMELCGHDMSDNNISDSEEVLRDAIRALKDRVKELEDEVDENNAAIELSGMTARMCELSEENAKLKERVKELEASKGRDHYYTLLQENTKLKAELAHAQKLLAEAEELRRGKASSMQQSIADQIESGVYGREDQSQ